jgi:hypothetical protein
VERRKKYNLRSAVTFTQPAASSGAAIQGDGTSPGALGRGTLSMMGGNAARSLLHRRSMQDIVSKDMEEKIRETARKKAAFGAPGGLGGGDGSPQHGEKDVKLAGTPTNRPATSGTASTPDQSPLFFRRPHTAIGARGSSGKGKDGRPMSASSGGSRGGGRGLLVKMEEEAGLGWSPDKFEKQRRHYAAHNKRSGITIVDLDDSGGESGSEDEIMDRQQMKKMAASMKMTTPVKSTPVKKATPKTQVADSPNLTSSDKAGMQLGFDLRSSLANLGTWVDEDSDEDSDEAGGTGSAGGGGVKMAETRTELFQRCQDVIAPADSSSGEGEDDIPYERGPANAMTDKEIVALLKQQPKDVPEMRTRESFRRFFARMKKDRFEFLLRAANKDKESKDADKKVAKRLSLVSDVLV